MSFFHNGKPLYCRPARTRCGSDKPAKLDADDAATKHLGILAEAAQLVAAGIRAGLVQRPTVMDEVLPELRADRPSNVHFKCDTCGEMSQRGKSSTMTTCLSCRLPPVVCKVCNTTFRRARKKQIVCSNTCKAQVASIQAQERARKRPMVPCVICQQPHPLRFAGGKQTQTCGQKCQRVFLRQIQTTRRERKKNNR